MRLQGMVEGGGLWLLVNRPSGIAEKLVRVAPPLTGFLQAETGMDPPDGVLSCQQTATSCGASALRLYFLLQRWQDPKPLGDRGSDRTGKRRERWQGGAP